MPPALIIPAVALCRTYLPVQYAVITRQPLPGSVHDALLVAVVAVALTRGPGVGMTMGFATGLMADLAPPADHTLGRLALAYCLAGYVTGLLGDEAQRSAFAPMAVVVLAAILAGGMYAAIGALLGDVRVTAAAL